MGEGHDRDNEISLEREETEGALGTLSKRVGLKLEVRVPTDA